MRGVVLNYGLLALAPKFNVHFITNIPFLKNNFMDIYVYSTADISTIHKPNLHMVLIILTPAALILAGLLFASLPYSLPAGCHQYP